MTEQQQQCSSVNEPGRRRTRVRPLLSLYELESDASIGCFCLGGGRRCSVGSDQSLFDQDLVRGTRMRVGWMLDLLLDMYA
jgi:hypothetical protein